MMYPERCKPSMRSQPPTGDSDDGGSVTIRKGREERGKRLGSRQKDLREPDKKGRGKRGDTLSWQRRCRHQEEVRSLHYWDCRTGSAQNDRQVAAAQAPQGYARRRPERV